MSEMHQPRIRPPMEWRPPARTVVILIVASFAIWSAVIAGAVLLWRSVGVCP